MIRIKINYNLNTIPKNIKNSRTAILTIIMDESISIVTPNLDIAKRKSNIILKLHIVTLNTVEFFITKIQNNDIKEDNFEILIIKRFWSKLGEQKIKLIGKK